MSNGYYKRRRGVVEHIENGTIDLLEDGIHDYLSLKANLVIGSPCSIPVGVVFTSAPALHAYCRRVSERTIQRILEHMEAIGWLKTFKIAGKRGNYPTLLCRASVHDLSGSEYRINGVKTTDWRHPAYEAVGEVSGSCPETGGTLSGDREVRSEKPETTHPAGELELATKEAAFEAFWERWPKKQSKPRALKAWKKIPISEYVPLMAGLDKWLRSDQWGRGVIPHASTWLNERRWDDEDIPGFGKASGTAPVVSSEELRRKRSSMTPEGKLLLEKAGGLIQ